MKKKESKKKKQTRSASLSRCVKKAIVLLLCAILLTNATLPKTEQKVEATPIVAPFISLGELIFGLLASAGIIYTGYEAGTALAEQDITFSEEYDIGNYGYDYATQQFINDEWLWSAVLDAQSKGSPIANEMVRIDDNIDVLDKGESWETSLAGSPNQPPSDPNKNSLKKLLIGTALSLQIDAALLSPINDVSQILQQQAQQQMQYSIYSEFADDTLFNNLSEFEVALGGKDCSITGYSGAPGDYTLHTVPSDAFMVDYSFDYSSGRVWSRRIIFSSHPFTYDTFISNRPVLNVSKLDYNKNHNFYYFYINNTNDNPSYFINPSDLLINEQLSTDNGKDPGTAANYIFENYGIGDRFGNQRTPYVPDMIGNKGHITNIGDIRPVYNNNQYFTTPTTNEIQNFYDNISNYYDTTNNDFSTDQQNIANYFNDFIEQHVHENEPVVTPAPSVAPPSSAPDPSAGPQPSLPPDDDNSKYTTPDLKNFFPFCIPWDIYDMFAKFTENRKAPVIEFHLKSEMFGFDHPVKIDLSSFDEVAAVCRLLELILFIIGLAVATRKLIGAGG